MVNTALLNGDSVNYEKTGMVSKVLTFSCVDGPGNRLVIFLQGCNYDCITCHNPHTINHCDHCGDCVAHCPTNALTFDDSPNQKVIWNESLCTQCDKCIDVCPSKSNPKITLYSVQELLELTKKHAPFLSGVTVSGGEATLQLPFIIEYFKAIKGTDSLRHLTCFIDSNGSLSEQGWNKVLPYLDGAMIDLKAWQNETHLWLVGRENHRVLNTISLLTQHNKLHEVRLLHIPNKTDLLTEVDAVSDYLKTLPEHVQIRLNAFQHHGVIGEALTWDKCSKAQMEEFEADLVQRLGRKVITPSIYT
ncbi:YjjW family glycine radical enzyme activase [Aliivibrio fischeri]|uniref:YjjW family glycine radical enzyme activase n=1 Tax=Aliivibrio fischeri TaxID=668 RepID=UPI0012DABC56|nr:YjjW family glycine radical enzyme activase [Aliivibrio fischeri]MUJ25409.1 YjjW family glycine radical enzyme activase [Aliivibrio fischeri]